MYDPQTAELIRRARPMKGVDPTRLPELLTEAFTELVSHRMSLDADSPDIDERLIALRSLASVYELHALLTPEHDLRRSAAFVAGSAHLLLAQIARARGNEVAAADRLWQGGVPAAVSAALLFVMAGQMADAVEACRAFPRVGEERVEDLLVIAIARLIRGELDPPLAITPPQPRSEDGSLADAVEYLWRRLRYGVDLLGRRLSFGVGSERPTESQIGVVFQDVLRLSVFELPVFKGADARVVSTLAGPHHLAALLASAAESLAEHAIVDTPTPPGLDANAWQVAVEHLATRRPYLWPNHRDAISRGYAQVGMSSVLSFPTGAGKSTLTELKVAATILSGAGVVFLAPTLALVSQCVKTLREAFPQSVVRDSLVGEGFFSAVDDVSLPDVAVMTPERCLFLLGLYPESFASVGLVIFDECHLLHATGSGNDRRSIDAMLCVLGLLDVAPSADFVLLSAMIENGNEMALWLSAVTGRPCISLDLEWKPTRQARGCVVYEASEIAALRRMLALGKQNATTKSPPTSLRRQLNAQPYGLFALQHTWASSDVSDYHIAKLCDAPVPLNTTPQWFLGTNKNGVAVQLAERLASLGIKSIVFTQSLVNAESICNQLNVRPNARTAELDSAENALLVSAVAEMGSISHVIRPLAATAVCHHSLLLPQERELSEMLFRRAGGASVAVATPTLAQGMNLPAGAVIIAGDNRYDPTSEDSEQLQAHELLNAAGRAGRAGHSSIGIVLVIPSNVATFERAGVGITLGPAWFDLKNGIFSKADHCLTINDPIAAVLDKIMLDSGEADKEVAYFLNRLPIGDEGGAAATQRLLSRSLGAFRAERRGESDAFNRQTLVAAQRRLELVSAEPGHEWCNRLASSTGIPAILLFQISQYIGPENPEWTVEQLVEQVLGWLATSPALMEYFLSARDLHDVLGYKKDAGSDNWDAVNAKLLLCCRRWLAGAPLSEIELALGTKLEKLGTCTRARKFIRRVVVDLSYLAGLYPQVVRERWALDEAPTMSLGLAIGATCLRLGYSRPELLALHFACEGTRTRVEVHQLASATKLEPSSPDEDFLALRRRAERALIGAMFDL